MRDIFGQCLVLVRFEFRFLVGVEQLFRVGQVAFGCLHATLCNFLRGKHRILVNSVTGGSTEADPGSGDFRRVRFPVFHEGPHPVFRNMVTGHLVLLCSRIVARSVPGQPQAPSEARRRQKISFRRPSNPVGLRPPYVDGRRPCPLDRHSHPDCRSAENSGVLVRPMLPAPVASSHAQQARHLKRSGL